MKTIVVTVKKNAGLVDTLQPVTVRTGVGGNGVSRLDALIDVVATEEEDGSTPVYDESTGKYIIRKLTPSDLQGDIDAGEF